MSTIADRVAQIVADHSGLNVSSVKPESRIVDDIGMDSLDIIETVMGIEDEFNIHISDEQADKWVTVSNITAYVEQKVGV